MKKEEIKQIKNKLIISILLCMVAFGLIGVSFAWFRNLQQLNTVALVQIPSRITLSGANRSELQGISLELTADDTQNENGEVTIRRVFCIESTADFWLEVIRTTNIEEMDIKIYPVQASNSNMDSGTVKGTDGVKTFYYIPDSESLNGSYINLNGTIATNELHGENYENSDIVQRNAEPLYWCTSGREVCNRDNYSKIENTDMGFEVYYRYYVLELSWNTSVQETDMVYLLASH